MTVAILSVSTLGFALAAAYFCRKWLDERRNFDVVFSALDAEIARNRVSDGTRVIPVIRVGAWDQAVEVSARKHGAN